MIVEGIQYIVARHTIGFGFVSTRLKLKSGHNGGLSSRPQFDYTSYISSRCPVSLATVAGECWLDKNVLHVLGQLQRVWRELLLGLDHGALQVVAVWRQEWQFVTRQAAHSALWFLTLMTGVCPRDSLFLWSRSGLHLSGGVVAWYRWCVRLRRLIQCEGRSPVNYNKSTIIHTGKSGGNILKASSQNLKNDKKFDPY